jgi:hypothetical protein
MGSSSPGILDIGWQKIRYEPDFPEGCFDYCGNDLKDIAWDSPICR